MAKIVFTNAQVIVNSVDLSSHVESVTIEEDYDEIELTAMGDTVHNFAGGLLKATLQLAFQQDFASSSVEQTIYPLINTTTSVTVRPVSGSNTTTNPAYVMTCLVSKWAPIDAKIGELGKTSVTWPVNSLSRATT